MRFNFPNVSRLSFTGTLLGKSLENARFKFLVSLDINLLEDYAGKVACSKGRKLKLLLGNGQGKLTSGNLLGRMPLKFLLQVFYLESHFGTVSVK